MKIVNNPWKIPYSKVYHKNPEYLGAFWIFNDYIYRHNNMLEPHASLCLGSL